MVEMKKIFCMALSGLLITANLCAAAHAEDAVPAGRDGVLSPGDQARHGWAAAAHQAGRAIGTAGRSPR